MLYLCDGDMVVCVLCCVLCCVVILVTVNGAANTAVGVVVVVAYMVTGVEFIALLRYIDDVGIVGWFRRVRVC